MSRKHYGGLLVLLAVAFAGWFIGTFRPWRFFYPALPLAALLGAYGLDRLRAVSRGMSILARAGILAMMGGGLCLMLAVALLDAGDYKRSPPRMSFVQYALGRVASDDFLREMGGGMYAPIVWMNENLPADARILYLGEARVYHARHPVLWSTAFDRHPLTEIAAGVTTPAELRGRFWVREVTHIYVNHREWRRLEQGYGYLADFDQRLLAEFLDRYGRVVFEHGPTVVYELTDGPTRE